MVILAVEITIFILLLFAGKKKKKKYDKPPIRQSKLEIILPTGYMLLNLLNTRKTNKYLMSYKRRVEAKIHELYGDKGVQDTVDMYLAEKAVITFLLIIFFTFVSTQIEADITFVIFSISTVVLLFYAMDKQLDEKVKKRRRDIQIELPEFINKLVLLVNAGMTVSGAVEKIVKENRKDTVFYRELGIVFNAINSGDSEIRAYEEFARRCRVHEVTMFAATLVQNLRKGNDQLVTVLKLQANACWESRKNVAKKLGEEASTKLIFPMMLIFAAILIMIMSPAVFQLKI